ncbi:MAG: HDOD domain-containing protein [Phycisphaerales bacterium]
MNYVTLEKVLASPDLPSLPAVALKVLELTGKPDVSLKQVASVIENDQAIAAKVLRTINSSFYGLPKRCGSIQQALALLGLQTVKGLVLGFSLAKSIDGGGESDISFDFLTYWRRCMYSAAAAKQLATATRRCDPDEAFVAGLMQDIGMVAMWRGLGDQYLQTLDAAGKQHSKLRAVEQKAFELDHASVSGEMARRWRFPEHIAQAVRFHHDSDKAPVESMHTARIVELGGIAAALIAGNTKSDEGVNRFCGKANEWFDIRATDALGMLQSIADLAQQMARVFGLNVGESPDIDGLVDRARAVRIEQSLPALNIEGLLEAEARDASDSVSGLPDRSVFVRDLDMALTSKSQSGSGSGVGICLVSLDDVKSINERHGPDAGDAALAALAPTIVDGVGRFGRAYRFVGTAFVGLVPRTDSEQLARLAEGIRKRVAETMYRIKVGEGTQAISLTVTCGVALCDSDATLKAASGITDREQLVRAAMLALTTAQQQGTNRVSAYKPGVSKAA